MYRKLNAEHIVTTADLLHRRIEERFPESGIANLAGELEAVAREAGGLMADIARPHLALRTAVLATVALLLAILVALMTQLKFEIGVTGWSDFVQGLDALVNDLVFVGVAVYFLLGLEARRKRYRVLKSLHVLRSLAHIVDMHQLTKDPDRLLLQVPNTASSPKRTLTASELLRYLDYSTEMLAIVGKVAAFYVQEFADPIVLDAASAVQNLAVDLSGSIGQKILMLDRMTASSGDGDLD